MSKIDYVNPKDQAEYIKKECQYVPTETLLRCATDAKAKAHVRGRKLHYILFGTFDRKEDKWEFTERKDGVWKWGGFVRDVKLRGTDGMPVVELGNKHHTWEIALLNNRQSPEFWLKKPQVIQHKLSPYAKAALAAQEKRAKK